MDVEKIAESSEDRNKQMPLVSRHISQLEALRYNKRDGTDVSFGILRMVQAHESFVYAFYERMFDVVSGQGFHGYKLLAESILVHKEIKMSGKVLALDSDSAFNGFASNDLVIVGSGSTDRFFDALVYTPMPFLFSPDTILAEVADFIEILFGYPNTANGVLSGASGPTSFVVMEPLTLQSLGLGFLCENVIQDSRISTLICGFAYQKE